jgi:hypothetical protein
MEFLMTIRLSVKTVSFLSIFAFGTGCAGDKCAESDCADTGSDMRADPPVDLEEHDQARSSWEGTPEGVGLLDFLNAESTTYDVLDKNAALDRRAAGNLIAHRDGGDRRWGTTDDDIYNTIDEVDAVRFVGARSIDRMIIYSMNMGWAPEAEELLGIYDGVPFTVTDADDTIAFVNTLDEATLDIQLGLDARAAESIAIAQPIDTIDQLSRLYFVGQGALTVLKSAALNKN